MKKMLNILSLLVGVLFSFSSNTTAQISQYVKLVSTNGVSLGSTNIVASFPIQTNQIVTLVGFDWNIQPQVGANLPNGSLIYLNFYIHDSEGGYFGAPISQTVTGVTNISIAGGSPNAPTWATFKITNPAGATVVSNYVPADAIVIPASATGNVQIILESSPDLVNWTAASPGTYSAASATNRFFRVRAAIN